MYTPENKRLGSLKKDLGKGKTSRKNSQFSWVPCSLTLARLSDFYVLFKSFRLKKGSWMTKKMGLILNLWMALALLKCQPRLSQNIHYSTLMEWSSENISKLRSDWVFGAFHGSGGKFFLLHSKRLLETRKELLKRDNEDVKRLSRGATEKVFANLSLSYWPNINCS